MHRTLQTTPAPAPFDARFEHVKLGDGTDLRYYSQGPCSRVPIVMLHGYSDSSFSFSRILPLLPADTLVIVPDQRGHGETQRPEGGYTMDAMAQDALEVLDALRLPSVTVVGHCMGSFVARQLAVLAPERVSKLVLVAAGPTFRNPALLGMKPYVDTLSDPVDPAFVRAFQQSTVHRSVPAEFLDLVVRESLKLPARVWKALMDGMLSYTPVESRIACPVLIIGGDRDAVFSVAEHQALAALITGARLQILAGVGHAPHWEDPKGFLRALLSFVC